MLSESKQMNSVPICGMHAIRIQSSVHSISRILRTTYNPFNILRTLLKAKREKKNEKKSMHKIYYKIFIVQREPKKKKLVIRITITITSYQSWPIRSEDFEEDDLTGRIIERTLNQVFHPRCQPNGNVETTLGHCVCILRVRVTASDETCIRLFSRVRSWIRGVACVHKFVPAWCAGGTRGGGGVWMGFLAACVGVCMYRSRS